MGFHKSTLWPVWWEQWETRNQLDGNTWFVGFITYRLVQSFFPNGFEIDTS